VLSFFSIRRNGTPPTPLPQASVSPPVLGVGAHSLAIEGLGESQFRRGDIHCGTLYIYVLCGLEGKDDDPLEEEPGKVCEICHCYNESSTELLLDCHSSSLGRLRISYTWTNQLYRRQSKMSSSKKIDL
jgi:hypothetical protein